MKDITSFYAWSSQFCLKYGELTLFEKIILVINVFLSGLYVKKYFRNILSMSELKNSVVLRFFAY